jgi:hypothetical protein
LPGIGGDDDQRPRKRDILQKQRSPARINSNASSARPAMEMILAGVVQLPLSLVNRPG